MIRYPSLKCLTEDHYRGIALALRCRKQALGQISPTGSDGLRKRAAELSDFFSRRLKGHFRAEEEILFPLVLGAHQGAAGLIQSLLQDHERICRDMASLATASNLAKLLFDLGDVLEQHMRREEKELFPLAAGCLQGDEADRLKATIEKLSSPWSEQ